MTDTIFIQLWNVQSGSNSKSVQEYGNAR
jgi:hypothetical protein